MSGQPAVLQVVILRDGLLVGTEVFVAGSYTLGSSASADLKLDDPSIAEQHAVLYFQNGRAAIQDAGAPSGVYVNGHRVKACEIRSVDEIACGPFVLKARVVAKNATAKHAPPPEVAALLKNGEAPPPTNSPSRRVSAQAPVSATMPSARRRAGAPGSSDDAVLNGAMYGGDPFSDEFFQLAERLEAENTRDDRPTMQVDLNAAPGNLPYDHQPTMAFDSAAVAAAMGDFNTNPGATNRVRDAVPQISPVPTSPPVQAVAAKPSIRAPAISKAPSRAMAAVAPTPAPVREPPPPNHPSKRSRRESRKVASARQQEPVHREPAQVRELRKPPPPPQPPSPSLSVIIGQPIDPPTNPVEAATPTPRTSFRKGPPDTFTVAANRRGQPRLYVELYWGDTLREARCFRPNAKRAVLAAPRDDVALPLYGFALGPDDFPFAETTGESFRVFVPPSADVARCKSGERFAKVASSSLEVKDSRRCMVLGNGQATRLTEGNMTVVAYVAPPPEKVYVNPLKGLPWLANSIFFVLLLGVFAFLHALPDEREAPDFAAKSLPPVAVKLMMPEKKKKEPEKPKPVEEKPKKAEVAPKEKPRIAAKTPPPKHTEAPPPPPEAKAIKALDKLTAAGPSKLDKLAMTSVLGSGPGKKGSNYHLTGLIGGQPIANAGLGMFGGGGGGQGGGIGTKGAELLHGHGGAGIGALGGGTYGHGQVGGQVTRAVARNVTASGSIDREAVAKVVNSHLQEVRACYEKALLRNPSISGKVVLEWTIATNGRVSSVKTKTSTLRDSSVESCIINELKGWVFPLPKGGTVIIGYPFLFNSVGY